MKVSSHYSIDLRPHKKVKTEFELPLDVIRSILTHIYKGQDFTRLRVCSWAWYRLAEEQAVIQSNSGRLSLLAGNRDSTLYGVMERNKANIRRVALYDKETISSFNLNEFVPVFLNLERITLQGVGALLQRHPFDQLLNLRQISLKNCWIQDYKFINDLTSLTALKIQYAFSTVSTARIVLNNATLKKVSLSNFIFSCSSEFAYSINALKLCNVTIERSLLSRMTTLRSLQMDHMRYRLSPLFTKHYHLEKLTLGDCRLTISSIYNIANLKILNLHTMDQIVPSIDFNQLKNLETLQMLHCNPLGVFPRMSKLQTLAIFSDFPKDLGEGLLSNLGELTSLALVNVKAIKLSHLTKLNTLWLKKTRAAGGIGSLTALSQLGLSNTEGCSFKGLTSLTKLTVLNQQVRCNLASLPQMRDLELQGASVRLTFNDLNGLLRLSITADQLALCHNGSIPLAILLKSNLFNAREVILAQGASPEDRPSYSLAT